MHELGITRNLVAIVDEAAKGRPVRKVWLEIGTRSALMPDAVRFCFDVVRQGTALQSAELEILGIAPGWHCQAGGHVHAGQPTEPMQQACEQCGDTQWRWRSGEELNVKAMEIESCA